MKNRKLTLGELAYYMYATTDSSLQCVLYVSDQKKKTRKQAYRIKHIQISDIRDLKNKWKKLYVDFFDIYTNEYGKAQVDIYVYR